jgi:hypothetical protein
MMPVMRTTLTLDEDVLDKAKAMAAKGHTSFRQVINEALRIGLQEAEKGAERRPFRTKAHPMGVRPGHSLDNVQELLAQAEGERFR